MLDYVHDNFIYLMLLSIPIFVATYLLYVLKRNVRKGLLRSIGFAVNDKISDREYRDFVRIAPDIMARKKYIGSNMNLFRDPEIWWTAEKGNKNFKLIILKIRKYYPEVGDRWVMREHLVVLIEPIVALNYKKPLDIKSSFKRYKNGNISYFVFDDSIFKGFSFRTIERSLSRSFVPVSRY